MGQTVRISRAVLVSSCMSGTLFLLGALLIDAWYGRSPRLVGTFSFAIFFALLVALSGILVQWPILRAMRKLRRPLVLFTGAFLSVVPITGAILLFRDADEDPATIAGFVRFWVRVPGEFLLPFLPMAISGAVLGWFATVRSQAPPNSA